jgi:uncharacterized protein YozE (UPF0346 family)
MSPKTLLDKINTNAEFDPLASFSKDNNDVAEVSSILDHNDTFLHQPSVQNSVYENVKNLNSNFSF